MMRKIIYYISIAFLLLIWLLYFIPMRNYRGFSYIATILIVSLFTFFLINIAFAIIKAIDGKKYKLSRTVVNIWIIISIAVLGMFMCHVVDKYCLDYKDDSFDVLCGAIIPFVINKFINSYADYVVNLFSNFFEKIYEAENDAVPNNIKCSNLRKCIIVFTLKINKRHLNRLKKHLRKAKEKRIYLYGRIKNVRSQGRFKENKLSNNP